MVNLLVYGRSLSDSLLSILFSPLYLQSPKSLGYTLHYEMRFQANSYVGWHVQRSLTVDEYLLMKIYYIWSYNDIRIQIQRNSIRPTLTKKCLYIQKISSSLSFFSQIYSAMFQHPFNTNTRKH